MKLTRDEAQKKYPKVIFYGDGNYYIESNVVIESNEVIETKVIVGSGVVIESDVIIKSGVHIGPESVIRAGAFIESGACIWAGAFIESNTSIRSNARIGAGRKGVKNTLILNGLGTTKQMTAHDSDDGLVIVIGCLNSHKGASLKEAKDAISKKYPESHPYFAALNLAQAWYENL